MDIVFEKIVPVDLRPIREIVLERLRDAILGGLFKPGERLVESDIAERLGVSRTPVREAFRQLEIEGLAENLPRRGTVVTGFTHKAVMEIYEIKEVLEGLAARLACMNMSGESLQQLRKAVNDMDKFVDSKNPYTYWGIHEQFCGLILYSTNNTRLIEQMKQLYEYLNKQRTRMLIMEERRVYANEEHKEILRAFELRDPIMAEAVSRKHSVNGQSFFLEKIKQK